MSPSGPLLLLIVLLAGAATAAQAPTNAMLVRALGSPVNAAFTSFLVGTAVLVALVLAVGARPDWQAARALPWYAWIGGAYGVLFVTVAIYAAPRLGIGLTLTLLVAGQLIMAMWLDSSGAFGLVPRPLTATRLAGVALVVAGVLLVRRG